jgi:endonuclease/exonuclease/phosphatase family metal-dependent hydrolase
MDPDQAPLALRVMVFNIEEGGTGVDLGQVVEAIRRADPDIVALEEATGNTARIADALGWGYASARTHVLSRHRIVRAGGPDVPFDYVEVRPGGFVAVASVHLPAEPYGPQLARDGATEGQIVELETRVRLPRFERILAGLSGLEVAGIPVFVLGDFNTPSHLDWTAEAVGLRPHVRLPVAWPVSLAAERAGFRDTWREIHPDPVADPGLTWWAERPPTGGYEPGPDTPNDRIDFIYAAGPSVTTACIVVGEAGRTGVSLGVDPWPSDHRAVMATVQVVPAVMTVSGEDETTIRAAEAVEPSGDVVLEVASATVRVGEPIEVHWSGGPALRWDWIAAFHAGTTDLVDAHLLWRHTGRRPAGSVTLDAEAAIVDQSSIGGAWPLPPGDYRVAYLLDDGPVAIAWADVRVIP